MANDRLYIICHRCDKWTMLFKFYPVTGYIGDNAEKFLNEHATNCSTGTCEPPAMSVMWENTVGMIHSGRGRWVPEE